MIMQHKTFWTSVRGLAHPLTMSESFIDSDILFEYFEILQVEIPFLTSVAQ